MEYFSDNYTPSHREIAAVAYVLYTIRSGSGVSGSADGDWYKAIEILKRNPIVESDQALSLSQVSSKAHSLWIGRGARKGTADYDWFNAIRILKGAKPILFDP